MGFAVGIDLGTTNSVVALSQGGRPRVLAGTDGSPLIPSVVSFHPNGSTLVGASARARRAIDPTQTVFSVKRLLGRPFQSEEVRRAKSRFAFQLREGPDAAVLVNTRTGDLSLPEISALVLREIRRVAETALGDRVDRAVVTVPANFNELQRTATKIAGQIADLDVIRILNEPTAAALAYGYGRASRERIAVYDFGGGTFDVTLLELSGNVFEVLATAGDTFLGGDDIDLLVTENLADALLQAHRIDARQDARAYELLRAAAEQAKIDLSTTDSATIRIPDVGYAPGGRGIEFRTHITRADLERLASPLVQRTFDVCGEALKLSGMRPAECGTVILVGGSSRMPAVRQGVAKFFGRDPLTTLPPEQVVGMGASILAEALSGARRQAAPPERPRVQTLRPQTPSAPMGQPASSVSQSRPAPPMTPRAPSMRPPTLGGSQRPPPGPAIKARPTDEGTTNAVLRQRTRSTTNPGIAPSAPLPSDLTWGSVRPPATPAVPTTPMAQDPIDLAFASFEEETRPSISSSPPSASPPLPDLGSLMPPALTSRDSFDEPTTPGARAMSVPAAVVPPAPPFPVVGTRTHVMPAAVPPPPQPLAPARKPGDSLFTGIPGLALTDDEPTEAVSTKSPLRAQTMAFSPAVMPGPSTGSPSRPMAPAPPAPRVTGPAAYASTLTDSAAFALPGMNPARPSAIAHNAAPGVSAKAPSAQMPPAMPGPSARMPSSQMSPAMPGPSSHGNSLPAIFATPSQGVSPAGPGASSRAPSGAMRPALPGVSARPPSLPPGHFGLPSMPPPQLPLLLDVTPHTLSIETVGGMCETVIPRNATIPVEQTREFATAYDSQDTVRIRISQGESRRFGENQALGELELSGIPLAARGDVKIAVTFELDADGTLQVRAREVSTGRETQTRVTLLTMPSSGEMANMAQRQRAQN